MGEGGRMAGFGMRAGYGDPRPAASLCSPAPGCKPIVFREGVAAEHEANGAAKTVQGGVLCMRPEPRQVFPNTSVTSKTRTRTDARVGAPLGHRALAKCPSLGIAHARSHSRNTIGLQAPPRLPPRRCRGTMRKCAFRVRRRRSAELFSPRGAKKTCARFRGC